MKSVIKTGLKLFHSHERNYPDIFIFSLGRSGSTLLAEILNTYPEIKLCSEPFVFNKHNLKVLKKYFPEQFLADRYRDVSESEFASIRKYINDLSRGKTWNSFYWSDFPGKSHSFKTNQTLFKLHKLTYLFDDIANSITSHGIYLLRHPLSHSLSRIRNGWDTYNEMFLNASKIEANIPVAAKQKAREVIERGDKLENFVLSWCLENFVFLRQEKEGQLPENVSLVTYEKLVSDPEKTLNDICRKTGIPFTEKMLQKVTEPSHGIVHSTKDTKEQIRSQYYQQLLSKWRKHFTTAEEEKSFAILEAFKFDLYQVNQILPVR